MTRPRPPGHKRLNLRPAAIRPPAPARPDPSDAIARIDTLTRSARASWLGLISYLAFVGVTLLGVEDADFFIPERQTDLPLIGVSIPTLLFFAVAPTLGAALYAYFHLHLLKLWDALRDALPPPAKPGKGAKEPGALGRLIRDLRSNLPATRGAEPTGPDDAPLGDRIAPWLVTDLALSFRKDALTHRPLRWIAFLSTGILSFIAGPLVLFLFWLWSMPAHNPLLTVVGCGLPFFVSVITCVSSWRQMRHRVLRTPSLTRVEKRRRDGAAWSVFAVITVGGWFATEGTLDHYARTWLGYDDDRIEAAWFAVLPVPADLAGVDFVGAGTRVELREKAKVAFRADWCAAQGIPPQACAPDGRTDTDAGRAFATAQREAWCAADLGLAPDACAARFRDLEATFETDWQTARAALLTSLDRRDLSGRDFRRANLWRARLDGADLSDARLEGADLRGARLEGADLRGARLEWADLSDARLEGADLSGARLEGANLRWARLEGAGLRGLDLAEATLDGASWHQAFGDGSVTLPEGYEAGKGELPHWEPEVLDEVDFNNRWRAWQAEIGVTPPEP